MRKNIFILLCGLFVLFAIQPAIAGPDDGLYDPLPPEGAAFVRFMNLSGDNSSKPVSSHGKIHDYLKNAEVTPYFVAMGGKTELAFGDIKSELEALPGKLYTVIWDGGAKLAIIEDAVNANRAKSQIMFYNFGSDEPVSLKTADGKIEVVPAAAKGTQGSREINPVKVTLAVYKGDKKLGDLGEQSLERGMSYSAIYTGEANKVLWVRSITNTTR